MLRTLVLGLLIVSFDALAQEPTALQLSDCRISGGPGYPGIKARCGTLLRPLDPSNPDSETISLSVAIVPALSLEPATDPLVVIAGGPGQASISFYAGWAHAFERIRRDRDILLIDQRGTGESAAMTCDIDDDIIEGQYSIEQTKLATHECLAALPYDPRFFTTSVAVTDLEALRVALAYTQLNLYGISYGTRVAQHYTRRYPAATRSVILDGVVPPQVSLGPEIATESQLAIERVLARCTKDPDCNGRYPDIYQDFIDLQQRLTAEAAAISLPNPVTGQLEELSIGNDEFGIAIRLLLYNHRTIALLPLLIHEAAAGNLGPLAAQFQMTAAELSESLSIGMHNAVMCTEDMPFVDINSVDREALASSYLGPLQLEALQTICSIWPAGVLDDEFKTPVTTDVPVLLLSGDADPITPPRYAAMAAANFRKAWLLTLTDQGHGQAATGCIPRLMSELVTAATLEGVDTSCIEEGFAMPFFLNFSGPAP